MKRKIKVGQVNDLLNTASSSRLSEEDAATFMNSFDTAFLDLYPSFVTEFNALLRKTGRLFLRIRASDHRTAHLCIDTFRGEGEFGDSRFALYTPRTIYNYRSTIKSRARNRETFESDVEQLCRVIHAE